MDAFVDADVDTDAVFDVVCTNTPISSNAAAYRRALLALCHPFLEIDTPTQGSGSDANLAAFAQRLAWKPLDAIINAWNEVAGGPFGQQEAGVAVLRAMMDLFSAFFVWVARFHPGPGHLDLVQRAEYLATNYILDRRRTKVLKSIYFHLSSGDRARAVGALTFLTSLASVSPRITGKIVQTFDFNLKALSTLATPTIKQPSSKEWSLTIADGHQLFLSPHRPARAAFLGLVVTLLQRANAFTLPEVLGSDGLMHSALRFLSKDPQRIQLKVLTVLRSVLHSRLTASFQSIATVIPDKELLRWNDAVVLGQLARITVDEQSVGNSAADVAEELLIIAASSAARLPFVLKLLVGRLDYERSPRHWNVLKAVLERDSAISIDVFRRFVVQGDPASSPQRWMTHIGVLTLALERLGRAFEENDLSHSSSISKILFQKIPRSVLSRALQQKNKVIRYMAVCYICHFLKAVASAARFHGNSISPILQANPLGKILPDVQLLISQLSEKADSSFSSFSLHRSATLKTLTFWVQYVPMNPFINGSLDLDHIVAGLDVANLHPIHQLQSIRLLIAFDAACNSVSYGMRGKAFSQVLTVLLPQISDDQSTNKNLYDLRKLVSSWLCTRLVHSGVLGSRSPHCEALIWIRGIENIGGSSSTVRVLSKFLDTAITHTCKRPDEAFIPMQGVDASSSNTSLLGVCILKHALKVATSDKMVEREVMDVVCYATSALMKLLLMQTEETALLMVAIANVLDHSGDEMDAVHSRSVEMSLRFQALDLICKHLTAVYAVPKAEGKLTADQMVRWHDALALLLGVSQSTGLGDIVEQYFDHLSRHRPDRNVCLLLIRQALCFMDINRRSVDCQEAKVEEVCGTAITRAIGVGNDEFDSHVLTGLETEIICTFMNAALKREGSHAQSALVQVMKIALQVNGNTSNLLAPAVSAVSTAVKYCLSDAAHASMPNAEFVETILEVALSCEETHGSLKFFEEGLVLRLLTVGRGLVARKVSRTSRAWAYLLLRVAVLSLGKDLPKEELLMSDIPPVIADVNLLVIDLVNELVKNDVLSRKLKHNDLLRRLWYQFHAAALNFWLKRRQTMTTETANVSVSEAWSKLGESTYRQVISLQAKENSKELWIDESEAKPCLQAALEVWNPGSLSLLLNDLPKMTSVGTLNVILKHACSNVSLMDTFQSGENANDASFVNVLLRHIRRAISSKFERQNKHKGIDGEGGRTLVNSPLMNLDGLIAFISALPLGIKLGGSCAAFDDLAIQTLTILESVFLHSGRRLPDLYSVQTLNRILMAQLPSDNEEISDERPKDTKLHGLSKIAAELFESVAIHPKFLVAMQSNPSPGLHSAKQVLCSLLVTLLRMEEVFAPDQFVADTEKRRNLKGQRTVQQALLPILMASYGGSTSEVDVTVWSLAQYINLRVKLEEGEDGVKEEEEGTAVAALRMEALLEGRIASETCFAWGSAALAFANAKSRHGEEWASKDKTILSSILYNHWPVDRAQCAVTVRQWLRPREQEGRGYDPRFILPFCITALKSGIVEPRTVVMQGMASIALRALSEDDVILRGMGYQTLGLLSQALSSNLQHDFRESKDVVSVLNWVQRSIPSPFVRIPVPHSLFFAQALVIACDPAHPLYLVLARSRLSGINSTNCCLSLVKLPPLLLRRRITQGPPGLGKTVRERHQGRRDFEIWATTLLTDGLYSAQDAWLYRKGGVFETAMALYDDRCASGDLDAGVEHLKLVCAGTKVPRVARDLSQRVGVIGWLASKAIQKLQEELHKAHSLHVHLAIDALISMTTLKAVVGQAPQYSRHAIEDYATVVPRLVKAVAAANFQEVNHDASYQQNITENALALATFALNTCYLLDPPTAVERELKRSLACFSNKRCSMGAATLIRSEITKQ